MGRLKAFGRFWYDFVVGDDWVVAAGVVGLLFVVYAFSLVSVSAWWAAPAGLAVLLPLSLRRAIRRG